MIHPEYDKNIFPYWTTIPIRFRDLDPLKHVNNAIFSTYYEDARIQFIQQVPSLTDQIEQHYSFVLANVSIDFVHPAEYPANLLVGTGIKSKGNTSISSFQAIYHEQTKKLISVSESHGVWFNLKEQEPALLPDIDHENKFLLPESFFTS